MDNFLDSHIACVPRAELPILWCHLILGPYPDIPDCLQNVCWIRVQMLFMHCTWSRCFLKVFSGQHFCFLPPFRCPSWHLLLGLVISFNWLLHLILKSGSHFDFWVPRPWERHVQMVSCLSWSLVVPLRGCRGQALGSCEVSHSWLCRVPCLPLILWCHLLIRFAEINQGRFKVWDYVFCFLNIGLS